MTKRKHTDLIVIHCTAHRPGYTGGVEGIRADHIKQGYSDIGYNALIPLDGEWIEGRGLDAVGAHVKGFNSRSLGVALIGGVDADGKPDASTYTAAQWAGLERFLVEMTKRYPNARICGHRDLSPDLDGDGLIERHEWLKDCPCFDAIPWAASKGLPAAQINGEWSALDPRRPEATDAREAWLQRLLIQAGYDPGPDDGIAGERTAKAIRAYQTAHGLPLTGKFDRVTVASLREAAGEPKPAVRVEKPGAGDGTVTSVGLGAAAAAAWSWFSGLSPVFQIALIAALIGLAVFVYRDQMRKAEIAAQAAAGDPLPDAEPDLLDWLWSWAQAMGRRLIEALKAELGRLAGGAPA